MEYVENIIEVFMDVFTTFDKLRKFLTSIPVIQALNCDIPFEIMCDASNYAIDIVLASHVIYYASRTLDNAKRNYSTTVNELFAIVFASEKFRQYLLVTKVIAYSNHTTLKYLMTNKDAKPRLIQWILLLHEFDLKFRDKSGYKNLVADHLSQITSNETPLPLWDEFLDEHLFSPMQSIPWYVEFVHFFVTKWYPDTFTHAKKDKLFVETLSRSNH
uniref:Reverse transcriptase RNase H-like domain-containing protein n=1 Tax=Lactuca sativa TaxID=4236 RepID=A0A9R1VTW8_LACSA|nr:hypothetical protein LSAT_V11C400211910 [Lactuca sativa]